MNYREVAQDSNADYIDPNAKEPWCWRDSQIAGEEWRGGKWQQTDPPLLPGHRDDRKGQPCCWYCHVSGEKAELERQVTRSGVASIFICATCAREHREVQE